MADRDTCPSGRAVVARELQRDRLVRQRERAARLCKRSERASRIVVAAGHDDRDAGFAHPREPRERMVQRGRPDLAALEEVAGDDEGMRAALDRQLADARERLTLGGADLGPHPGVEARAGGVEVAIRRVDDPQHGCRRLALRSAGARLRTARPTPLWSLR